MLDQFDNRIDPSFPFADRGRLLSALNAALPADCLVTKAEGMRVYESDGLAAYRGMPSVVALPRDTDQIRAVLKVCSDMGVPVVARGAGTGLSGGALPSPGCVLLSLSRMSRIIAIDPQARTARR